MPWNANGEREVQNAWRCLAWRAPRGGQRHVAAQVAVNRGDRAAPDGDSRDAKDTAGDARACAD